MRLGIAMEDSVIDIRNEDSVLIEEFNRIFGRRDRFQEPEKKLLLAVLYEALYQWTNLKAKRTLSNSERHELTELKAWLTDYGTEDVFSFDSICDELGFSASWIRKKCGIYNGSKTNGRG